MLILFIDDDYEDYEIFCEATQGIGRNINCVFEHNGAEGLRYLQNASDLPDYVFLDLNMPVMNGVECLRKIRLTPRLLHIPVIIFSSAIDPAVDYRKLGATEVHVKPDRYEDLVRLLTSVIERRRER